MLVRSATKSSHPTYRLEERKFGRSQDLRPSTFLVIDQKPSGPGGFVYSLSTSMDANHESSIFDINHLRAALERLDLKEVATRTYQLAEDYMPAAAWLDSQGRLHFAETMGEIDGGLVLCQATDVDPDSPEEVPFWVAPWLDELFPDIAERLRNALAQSTWGSDSAPETDC